MKKLEVGDKVYCKKQRYRPDIKMFKVVRTTKTLAILDNGTKLRRVSVGDTYFKRYAKADVWEFNPLYYLVRENEQYVQKQLRVQKIEYNYRKVLRALDEVIDTELKKEIVEKLKPLLPCK